LDDGLGQDPHLLLVFDDENDSHGPCPTLYASAPTERSTYCSRKCYAMVDRVHLADVDDRQADKAGRRDSRGRHEAGKKKPRKAGFKSRRKRP
jgi:hypothetical protein